MTSQFQSGRLKKWDDDKGYGFITPDDASSDVFVHISACQGATRRPKQGDVLIYERVVETNGKLRASSVSIQGVASRNPHTIQSSRPQQSSFRTGKGRYGIVLVMVLLLLGMGLLGVWEMSSNHMPPPLTALIRPGCTIKGNISLSSGARVYHLFGMEDYQATIIDRTKGEHWFCTEAEAIAQGWHKAPR